MISQRSGNLTGGEETQRTHWVAEWVGHLWQSGGCFGKDKNSDPSLEWHQDIPAPGLVTVQFLNL